MNAKPVKIVIRTGYSHCDECGNYGWGHVDIWGKELVTRSWCDHLCGDIQGPDRNLAEFLQVILAAVGVTAEVTLIDEDET